MKAGQKKRDLRDIATPDLVTEMDHYSLLLESVPSMLEFDGIDLMSGIWLEAHADLQKEYDKRVRNNGVVQYESAYKRDQIDEVKSTMSIVELITESTPLTKIGKEWRGKCPVHDGKSDNSLSVNSEKGLFFCNGCQVGGDIFNWLEFTEGWDFKRSLWSLANQNGIELERNPSYPEPDVLHDDIDAAWEVKSLKDAYKPKPVKEYIVNGVFGASSLSIVYGAPGSLKSMIMMDMALCVASGNRWLEKLPDGADVPSIKTIKSGVMWVDVDNGTDTVERRFDAIGHAHEVPEDAPFYYVSFPQPVFNPSRPESIANVIGISNERDIKLIVFDNLGTISGGADENSSQMIDVMSGLRQIAEKTRAAVVVIHHRRKSDGARAGDDLRGHSSINGSLDLALLIDREEDSDGVTMRSTKTRNKPVVPTSALWTYDQDPAGELKQGRFYGTGYPDTGHRSKAEMAWDIIEKSLWQNKEQAQTDLVEMCKKVDSIGRNTVLTVLNDKERSGILVVRSGPNNAKLYSMPDNQNQGHHGGTTESV